MAGKKVLKLASRGKRFGAACIDAIAPVTLYLIFFSIMAANGMGPGYQYGYGDNFGYGYGYGYNYGFNAGSRLSGGSAAAVLIIFVLLITYLIVEFVFFAKGKSIGKAALGLQVVSSINGKPFGFAKMLLRECIVKGACGSTFFLGYIWILIDEKNRGWHDKILDSYVVDLKESAKLNKKRAAADAKKAAEAPAAVEEKVTADAGEAAAVKEVIEAKEEPSAVIEPVEAAEVVAEGPEASPEPDDGTQEAIEPEDTADTSDDNGIEIEPVVIDDDDTAPSEETAEEPAAKPALSMSMKKDELVEAARMAGVSVSSRATKADIIEAIEKAYSETE